MRRESPLRAQISTVADGQLGHITRVQLLAMGVTIGWIRSQIRLGWLIPVHAGVYAIGHVPRHALAGACAATLACGEASALSHAAAAALWGAQPWPRLIEIVAPYERRRPGIWTHRSVTLTPGDVRTHQGIRVTSPLRTVADLQPRLNDAQLTRLVNELRVGRHLNAGAFAQLRAQSLRVNKLLGGAQDDTLERPTRSALEDMFRRFTRRHNLPMPQTSAILPHNGREVDALYPAQKLIVELDSWKYHSSRASFERDRAKDADALEHGYRTLRITDDRLTRDGSEEAARIHRILGSDKSESQ
jgi:very-short-patch-repair endonuclease